MCVQCVVVLAYNNFIMWQMCSSYSLQQLYNVADVQYSYGVCTLYSMMCSSYSVLISYLSTDAPFYHLIWLFPNETQHMHSVYVNVLLITCLWI